ncbi:MAG: Mu transposase C-terminal domain-containing protein [Paracoccaceae bacterium]
MAQIIRREFLTFSLDKNHIYKLNGLNWRFVYETDGTATFSAIDDPQRKATYDIATLNRLSAAGHIGMEPYGLLAPDLRLAQLNPADEVFLTSLPPEARARLEARYAMVQGYLALRARNAFRVYDPEIARNMSAIREEAAPYLVHELPDPEADLKLAMWKAGQGPKPRSKLRIELPDAVSPRTLRKWVSAFNKGGKKALIDSCDKQGNRNGYFTVEESALMAQIITKEYLSLQRKTVATVVKDVKMAFTADNELRSCDGRAPLRTPGREAVRRFIARLDKFQVLVARFGQQEAMKRMRPTKDGFQANRPLEAVGMDEWRIDLLTIFSETELLHLIDPENREDFENKLRRYRWWLVAAIDYRTRCILGLTLTPNPSVSSAIKCLGMVTTYKGQFSDDIGALAPWSMFGTPERLFVDNGSAFKAGDFTNACIDLGVDKVQTIAGAPAMRGKIERVFRTLGVTLLPRLSGRTFGSTLARANHPSEERACLTIEDLAYALVRWTVDVYHNSPHEGLGGRTPLQQWQADLEEGNYPLMPAPELKRRRIALGLSMMRVVHKGGVRVMSLNYTSPQLAAWFLKKENCDVEVRWLEEDIGSIAVKTENGWVEAAATTPAVRGMNALTWVQVRRSLRNQDPSRKEWEESVVLRAIKDVEALNASRQKASNIIDHGWSKERFEAVEREAMMNFNIIENRPSMVETPDGYGRSIIPVQPEAPAGFTEDRQEPDQAAPVRGAWKMKD